MIASNTEPTKSTFFKAAVFKLFVLSLVFVVSNYVFYFEFGLLLIVSFISLAVLIPIVELRNYEEEKLKYELRKIINLDEDLRSKRAEIAAALTLHRENYPFSFREQDEAKNYIGIMDSEMLTLRQSILDIEWKVKRIPSPFNDVALKNFDNECGN